MNDQANTKLIQQAYQDFKAGDIQALLNVYAEDIQWNLPEVENIPFTGKRQGRERVGQFFSELAEAQEPLEFEPHEFIAQGDRVVVLGHYRWRVKATGRDYASDYAHVWTITDGKITAFQEYTDTAASNKAFAAARSA